MLGLTDVTMIVGDYGRQWRALPVTANSDRGAIVFVDRRTPAALRRERLAEMGATSVTEFHADRVESAR